MKFDRSKTFPYPVLRPYSDDYVDAEFQALAEFEIKDNNYTNGNSKEKGFSKVKQNEFPLKKGIYEVKTKVNSQAVNEINNRLAIHNIRLTDSEITEFNSNWILKKK
jgi:hypothetical protein